MPSARVPATTSESKELRAEATRLIKSAAKELVVASFGWDEDHEILEFLRVRASEGLAVTVLARVRASQMPALLALAESGARVLGFKWLHAKALCVDGARALVMSANLQTEGLDRGFELGIRLDDDRAKEVSSRLDEWAKAARWELLASPTLGDIRGNALVWQGNRLEEMTVEAEHRIGLGSVTAESADNLDDPAPSIPAPEGELPKSAHEIIYEWSTRAPVLAANAKPVLRAIAEEGEKPAAYDPPVFDEPGGRRVVVVTSERQLPKARQVAASTEAAAIVVHE